MPIEIQCPKCSRRFRVPDKFAGKRAKCPNCQGTIEIPAPAEQAAQQPAAAKPAPKAPAQAKKAPKRAAPARKPAPEQWYVQTEDGDQYGPVTREELEAWVAENRIDASCQLLREGWEQWKWAGDIFPQLAESPAEQAVEENPFAGIGEAAVAKEVRPLESPQVAGGGPPGIESAEHGEVTTGARRALRETKPWVTFLAILGFIVGGLGALGGLVALAVFALAGGMRGILLGLVTLVGPALYLVLSYYLFAYGQRISGYLRSNQPNDLERALIAQKSFWKLTGILTAIALALYLLMVVALFALASQGVSELQEMPGMSL